MTAYEMRISDWSSDVCSSDLVVEGAGPLVDFLEDRLGDLALCIVQLFVECAEPIKGVRHGPLRRHADILARDLHRERFGAQARAMACLARMRRLIFAQLLAHPRAFGLEQAAIEVADHALERLDRKSTRLNSSH